jgi:hypothetical protein
VVQGTPVDDPGADLVHDHVIDRVDEVHHSGVGAGSLAGIDNLTDGIRMGQQLSQRQPPGELAQLVGAEGSARDE